MGSRVAATTAIRPHFKAATSPVQMVHFHVSHPFLDAGLLSSDLRALWTGASARHSQFTLTACLVFLVLSGSFPHPNPNSLPGGDQSTAPLLSSSEVFCTRYTHELPLRYFLKIAFYSPTISYKNGLSYTLQYNASTKFPQLIMV